ncbi:MAG: glycosyltransferase [Caldilineae bacterium]|nr:MAG: glycosyltransferase [Caldilineae bacterium]
MTVDQQEKLRCSVCITAYNEEANIGQLLQAMLDQLLHEVEITEIVVVASACTDRTVPIVREFMARDPRIKLIEQERREGKTAAINAFLKIAKEDIIVLESGDTLPHESAVEHLVRMFRDPTVGMTGAHKVPVNTPDHIVGLFTYLRLQLEHELCLDIPRLGEMIAFRKVFDQIPPDVAMDEAFVEAIMVQRGMQVRYAPDAVVYNTGPTTLGDFVRQRRRNHAGHLYLKHKYGYQVSSLRKRKVALIALRQIWQAIWGTIQLMWVLFLLAVLESWSRLLGWYDFKVRGERHVVWDMAWSQKANVRSEREAVENRRQKALETIPSAPVVSNEPRG